MDSGWNPSGSVLDNDAGLPATGITSSTAAATGGPPPLTAAAPTCARPKFRPVGAGAAAIHPGSELPNPVPQRLQVRVGQGHRLDRVLVAGGGDGFLEPIPGFVQPAQLGGVAGQVVGHHR